MYFSSHNGDITYDSHWGGLLEVCGTGAVVKEDATVDYGQTKTMWKDAYDLSFTNGITSIGPGFIENCRHIRSLIISYTVESIAVTPELLALLRKNKTVVRGWFDSCGERFAKENGLPFLHADLFVGWHNDERHYTNTKFTIRFKKDGTVYREYDEYCPGISAGNNGGGVWTAELEADFYKDETLEGFAERFPNYTEAILENKDLAYFFRTAARR